LQTGSISIVSAAAVLCLTGLALMLRLDQLQAPSFWFDEANAWRISRLPWLAMWDSIARDAHPPFYFLQQRLWQQIAGDAVSAARILSLLWGIATLPAALLLLQALLHPPQVDASQADTTASPSANPDQKPLLLTLALAGLLLACSPLQIEAAQEARPYACLTCLSLLTAWSFWNAWLRPERPALWVRLSLLCGLLSLTHYYSFFLLAGLLVFAGLEWLIDARRQRHAALWKFRLPGLFGVAATLQIGWLFWFPVFETQYQRATRQLWMPPVHWEQILQVAWCSLTSGRYAPAPAQAAGLLTLLPWMLVPLWLCRRHHSAGRLLALLILSVPCGALLYSLQVRSIWGVRYFTFSQAFLLIGIAWLAGSFPGKNLRGLALLSGLLWCSWSLWQFTESRTALATHAGLKQAIHTLQHHSHAHDRIVVADPFAFPSLKVAFPEHPSIHLRPSQFHGQDYRADLLAGPSLQAADFLPPESTLAAPSSSPPGNPPEQAPPLPCLWTVNTATPTGVITEVFVPAHRFRLLSEQVFPEFNGLRFDVVLRQYSLRSSADP
jgi:hypothetical protein